MNNISNISRRNFLKISFATASGFLFTTVWTDQALARKHPGRSSLEDLAKYDFLFARVKFDCDRRVPARWNVYPSADQKLLNALRRFVRCSVKPVRSREMYGKDNQFNAVVDFNDREDVCRFPFLFMTAEGKFRFSQQQKQNVKYYLEQGGFLLMDDCCWNGQGDYFYQSACDLMRELFGADAIKKNPHSHEIFHNVFNFGNTGLPYLQGQKYGAKGVFLEDRLAVFLSATDLHCGWEGLFQEKENRKSLEMGVNIIMYALSH